MSASNAAPSPATSEISSAVDTSTPSLSATWTHSRPDSDRPDLGDVALAARRARLARIVRGVVVASALVCLAGGLRQALRSMESEEPAKAARHAGSAGRDPAAADRLEASVDSLSDRTLRAMHVDERRASRGKKPARNRYTW